MITGSGFTGATDVEFGSVRAVVTALSDTKITVTSPPDSGTVDITVVTPVGTSATDPADQFSYQS
jgi:predicted PilT family ATPase